MLDMPPVILVKGNKTFSFDVPSDWIEDIKVATRSFIDSITDRKQPDMDIDFSTKVLDVALSIYKSSESESIIYTGKS
jgi:hypothetical protein